jgi:dTDP-4-amino-4,6-dideoxygalactose transaminase
VDIDAGIMNPASAAAAVGPRTRAIVVVHLYGQMADVHSLLALGVPVVEDCAQAHGAQIGGVPAGTLGALGAYSFYPTKNLGALGDAGAVVTTDAGLDARLRLLRQYGQATRYEHIAEGVNSRLDELQAAFLRAKLAHLEAGNRRRREIAAIYDRALAGQGRLRPLRVLPDRLHARHLYVARAADRTAVQGELRDRGIGTLAHYPRAVHEHPPYADRLHPQVPLTNSEQLAREVVSMPLHPQLTDDEVAFVAHALGQLQ